MIKDNPITISKIKHGTSTFMTKPRPPAFFEEVVGIALDPEAGSNGATVMLDDLVSIDAVDNPAVDVTVVPDMMLAIPVPAVKVGRGTHPRLAASLFHYAPKSSASFAGFPRLERRNSQKDFGLEIKEKNLHNHRDTQKQPWLDPSMYTIEAFPAQQ